MESIRDIVLLICAFVAVGGVLFMISFITYLVVRGALRRTVTEKKPMAADATHPRVRRME